jgi:mannose-6-phosphate isomerase
MDQGLRKRSINMKNILFLKPVFKTMIWGGTKLATEFGYEIPSDSTGECWAISAHKNGDCEIKNGEFQGKTLSWLWDNHRELFGNARGEVYPLLIKIIDARTDLSIQVHPDDDYAREHEEGALGKTECWYVLDCDEDGEIVIGHNASDKEELTRMIQEKRWKDLIRINPVKKGDFFQIEPGTVHAIKKGTLILETQQNSDITYRLYDYDRLDQGKPRELHIDKSIDVIRCPHKDIHTGGEIVRTASAEDRELIACPYYSVRLIRIHEELELNQDKPFLNVSVINGSGEVDGTPVSKGDHFILPFGYGRCCLNGGMELIVSHIAQ